MTVLTIPRVFGGTLLLTPPSQVSTLPTLLVAATFRDGAVNVLHRDGEQKVVHRDGIVQEGGR